MKKKTLLLILLLSGLTGCYATTSGVIPFGPGTFTVTTDSELGGLKAAKKSAVQEANAYCTSRGRKMMPVNYWSSIQKDFLGDRIPTYDFTFKCLSINKDTELDFIDINSTRTNTLITKDSVDIETDKRMALAQKCRDSISDPSEQIATVISPIFNPKLVDDYCTWFSWDNRDNVIKGKMMSCGLRPIDAVIIQIESTSQSGKKSTQKYKCGFTSTGYALKGIVKTE